jgi:hypothetical protein
MTHDSWLVELYFFFQGGRKAHNLEKNPNNFFCLSKCCRNGIITEQSNEHPFKSEEKSTQNNDDSDLELD